jgi:WXG100 family type VII secretion target
MLRLDYEALDSSARQLLDEMENFNECIEKMSAVIDRLPDIWEAKTCDRYVEQFEDLKPDFVRTKELIGEMAEQMQAIAKNFEETDSGMAGQI